MWQTREIFCANRMIAFFFFHFLATGLLCGAIMSDHWEEIGWDKEDLMHANVNLTWYLDGQVAMLKSSVNHRVIKNSSFLVPMHGGIWIMCVTLSGTSCYNFKTVRCNHFFTYKWLSPLSFWYVLKNNNKYSLRSF